MEVIEITTTRALERLRAEWISLWRRVPSAGPFQHPDWLLPWWRHFDVGMLLTLAVRDGGNLLGLAPFYIHSDRRGRRQLTLLGNGITDSCDILFEWDRADGLSALADKLVSLRGCWNAYDLRDIPAGSALIPIMRRLEDGVAVQDEACVVVALKSWQESGDRVLPPRIRSDLRRRRKRAEEIGPVRCELVGTEQVPPAMEALFALHASRWHARGQSGVLSDSDVEAFHREIAERFSRRRWLRLLRLYIGDRIVAVNYGFSVRGRTYFYIGGFDPSFARIGVGGLVLCEMMQQAAWEGAHCFDFLRGQEEYKLRWGGIRVPQYRLQSSQPPGSASACGSAQ